MATEQDYLDLAERHQSLLREHAVLTAQEETKATRREEIKKKLREAGIDPDKPDEEITRLEKEAADALSEARTRVDEFERKLKAPTSTEVQATPPKPEPEPEAALPVEEAPAEPAATEKADADDIDIG